MVGLHIFQSGFLKHLSFIFLFVFAALFLSSCDMVQNTLKADREANLEMQDYRDGLASRMPETEDDMANAGNIPSLQPYLSHSAERMKPMPLVSISINQSVPIRDALFELAEQANYDIELDPRIRGSVIFTARNRPFDQVIERLADIAGLRYKFEDDILRVELDTPYNKVYKIDYLSYIRSNSGSISNNISVVSGDGADSGSNFEAVSESEANFWGELETNLEQIVLGNQSGALKTKRDPRIVATEQNPDVQAVSPDSDANVTVQPPEAVLRVEALPVDDEDNGRNSKSKGGEDENLGRFTINRQAGLINVYASEGAHEEVAAYIKLLKRAVTSQVLIEAKILEVSLNDEFVTGVDWSFLGLSGELALDFLDAGTPRPVNTLLGSPAAALNGATIATGTSFVAGYTGNDVQSLIEAVSGFGTVKALASPRLTVLNNQSAVLNVATNRVFFEVDIDVTTEDGTTNTDIDSEIRNVPEGVLVNVQPSVDLEKRSIALALRPTITSVVRSINDPAVAFAVGNCGAPCAGITSPIPELNVQEIDSVIQVRSGQPVVMGGLLQDRIQNSESGVPILGEVPMVGNLFKDHDDLVQKTELVIFLKATILDAPGESVHSTDKDLYRQFSSDRRPLRF